MMFQLDPRLANDCYQLAESESSAWLLLNNSYFPWFIIVPKTQATELYQLNDEQQQQLQHETNLLSEFAHTHFQCDKLNVASIGNIVKQMHIHIVVRNESDPCWPGVVWGNSEKQFYQYAEVVAIQKELKLFTQNSSIKEVHLRQFNKFPQKC